MIRGRFLAVLLRHDLIMAASPAGRFLGVFELLLPAKAGVEATGAAMPDDSAEIPLRMAALAAGSPSVVSAGPGINALFKRPPRGTC
jgi:hypothetical protein